MSDAPAAAPVRIGLLGCGTVGQGLVGILAEQDAVVRSSGRTLRVVAALVRDAAKPRPGVDPSLLTTDPDRVLDPRQVDMVVEVMGGVEPTHGYLRRALSAGIPVVTANKQLISRHGPGLLRLAEENGTQLRFEAAVCAAVPVIKVLRESLLAAGVTGITGIVNGTTNFILTRMSREGLGYDEALRQAQELGYAEADPTEDVGGGDAAAKMAILASIAFHTTVGFDDVPHEGIDGLHAEDIRTARELSYLVKLLGVARLVDGRVSVRVFPALVPYRHRLSAIADADNAVLIESETAGELMLVGPGAGGIRTASAVLADVMSILGTREGSFLHNALTDAGVPLLPAGRVESAFYVRMRVADQPGVLSRVAAAFSDEGLSIRSVIQRGEGDGARLVVVTHPGPEARMEAALDRIRAMPDMRGEPVMVRVLGSGEGDT